EIRGKVLGRKIRQDEIIATADMLKEVGIGLHTFNMIGIPGETRKNIWDTIRLNRRIRPDKTQLTVFYPYPYTVLGDYCFNKKLVHKKSDDSYFTSSILKRNGRGLSLFEIKHFVSFFKIYVFWGWNRGKVREEFRRLIKRSLPYTIMDKVKKRLARRFSIQEEFSAKEIEMKYWKKTGLSKGKEFYKKYLELFGISTGDFADKSVGDFGCGPFGGIISVLNGFKKSYPIDILADEYNKWNVLAPPLIRFDGVKTDLPDGILDILFLTNVIDHTRYPQNIIKEAYRLLRKGGTLCLHVHLRGNDQLNKAHPVAWDEKLFLKRFEKFKIDWYKTEDFDWINDDKYRMLYGKLIK
ncbi:MAG: methyltransferase domain-containing protein, partial [Thermodesulfobacteriota bacterium]